MKAILNQFWSEIRTGGIDIIDSDGKELFELRVAGVNAEKINVRTFVNDVKSHCERVAKAINDGAPDENYNEDLLRQVPKVGEVYRHFKGGEYIVVGLARCTETKRIRVMYRNTHEPTWKLPWDRSLTNWLEPVKVNGVQVSRFKLISRR